MGIEAASGLSRPTPRPEYASTLPNPGQSKLDISRLLSVKVQKTGIFLLFVSTGVRAHQSNRYCLRRDRT
ncbi:hypothetical protein [Paraburkholderia atlantica]|uniref:hypothetical protein n=1 Tax=Paraburkholderia atlantica TaxID=2654982 RepID=UPI003D1B9031